MKHFPRTFAVKKCEEILLETKKQNIEANIQFSDNQIIDRLLARREEMKSVYEELYVKLKQNPQLLENILDLLIGIASQWNPEEAKSAREEREKLTYVNRQIATKADELAKLVEQRSMLENTSSFSSGTHYHIVNVIREASKQNYSFKYYLEEKLGALQGRFDGKYWPSLAEIITIIAEDAKSADIIANDPVTEAMTVGIRPSLSDYYRAILEGIEMNYQKNCGLLPNGFSLTDNAIATFTNCSLDLQDNVSESTAVKSFRSRELKKLVN
ncbi:hypothetical protein [Acinetobacter sp. PK01]|uniref:hypothetical protein n=1 Tax=Acinetobacter sp. PK01 TaxID=2930198 RepID=UPI001FB64006|nr:hypothetical protein [Acinetobacter sp. PK01]UOG18337.1 hypothetical protein MP622_01540 [Acinetobacter sp. PK01]